MDNYSVELVNVAKLKHIEGFSKKRVDWLYNKILDEEIWKVPIRLDSNFLVLDGQHRMEVAKRMNLRVVPAILYNYQDVKVWSLRPKTQEVTAELVIKRALKGDIYPYKTAKHSFPEIGKIECCFKLSELR